MTGAELIAVERQRQVEEEGWTPEHDDEHDECEMLLAALCYANRAGLDLGMTGMEAGQIDGSVGGPPGLPHEWPWARSWWKPSDDPLRNLVKAGALIAAELDRLQREADAMTLPEYVCEDCMDGDHEECWRQGGWPHQDSNERCGCHLTRHRLDNGERSTP